MKKVNGRNKWSLSIGCIGRDMCYTMVSLFMMTYILYTGMTNDAQFTVLTIIIVLCRVWDAVNDPMMGTIITNTRTKFGKYRPWVLIGAISNAIILVLMFSVRFESGWANVAFLGSMYLLWGMTFTMNDISYWGLLPVLAVDKKERDGLTTLVAVFASLGAFAAGGLIPMLTPNRMIVAYRYISLVIAAIFLLCQLLVFFQVHDNKEDTFIDHNFKSEKMEKSEEKITLKSMFKILIGNKQLLIMALVVFLYSLGSAILNAFGQNFFYFKFSYGGSEMFIFTVIYAVGTLVSQALYPMFANKFKRSQLLKISTISLIIGYVAFFAFANLDLHNLNITFALLCILGVFIFAGQGIFYLTMLVMLTNTIEYGEYTTGKNESAIVFSVRPFMVKLASAVQYLVVSLTVLACGLKTLTDKIANTEQLLNQSSLSQEQVEAYKQQIQTTIDSSITNQMFGYTLVMTLVPVVLFIVAYVVCKRKYIIDEVMYDKMVLELNERKANKE